MKHQAIQYLAFDVHQATTVASLRDASGTLQMRATVPTEAKPIVRVVTSAGARVHVAFEEGVQAQWLYDLLLPYAERVVVCNKRGSSPVTNKSDVLDADQLSEDLWQGRVREVFHGGAGLQTLNELVRNYTTLVNDAIRVMQRIKAMYRGRAIEVKGTAVYRRGERQAWLEKLKGGARVRAEALYRQLDLLQELRGPAKSAMVAEARRQPGWKPVRSIPYLGDVRTAQILAILRTPHRFRTKRNLWPYAGLAVITRSSSDQEVVEGRLRRKKRAPITRGLNRNHNPQLKAVFKGAANAATARPGPLREWYEASLARGVREELAKVSLARKIAAIVLRLWKKGELWDPDKLTIQAP
jgi:hypothetical protein